MKRVLILTSNTGGGHWSVARTLGRALTSVGETAVTIADPFIWKGQSVVGRLNSFYAPVIVRFPLAWGPIYHGTNSDGLFRVLALLAHRLGGDSLSSLLNESKPDAVISVHPLCNHLTVQGLKSLGQRVPLVTVPTELACLHAAWVSPDTHCYIVASEEMKRAIVGVGVEATRVHCHGIPIDPLFASNGSSQGEARRALGLDEGRFTALVTGGGEGAGGLLGAVNAIAEAGLDLQLLVVCGRNRSLRRKLDAMRLNLPVRVFGFVQEMPALMGASDVVITKAGSVTIAEAMAAGKPIALIKALPGQEQGNIGFVVGKGLGAYTPSPSLLVKKLQGWMENPEQRALIGGNAHRLSRPLAALEAARLVSSVV